MVVEHLKEVAYIAVDYTSVGQADDNIDHEQDETAAAVGLEAFAVVHEADNVCSVAGDKLAEVDDMNYYCHWQRKTDISEHHLPERHDDLEPAAADPAGRMCPGQSLYLAPTLIYMLATGRPGSEAHSGLEHSLGEGKADNDLLLTL